MSAGKKTDAWDANPGAPSTPAAVEQPGCFDGQTVKKAPSGGMGSVARKVASRTTDLIVIAVVVIAALTLGRTVIEWWHEEPPELSVNPGGGAQGTGVWGDGGAPVSLEFGDAAISITRRMVRGDREQGLAALVETCIGIVRQNGPTVGESVSAEATLLNRVAEETPVAEEPDAWQVFRIEKPFPVVVGTRWVDPAAARLRRLVCWGLLFPAGEKNWLAYVFHPAGSGTASATKVPVVPLPPGGRRLLGLRDERGGSLVGFSGSGSPETWMKFYEEWFGERDWTTEGWQVTGSSWGTRFLPPEAEMGIVEVEFALDGQGGLTGVISVLP